MLSESERKQIQGWLSDHGQIWVDVDLPHSGTSGKTYWIAGLSDLDDLLAAQSDADVEVRIFRDNPFPLSGTAGEGLFKQAKEVIPDNAWYQIVSPFDRYPSTSKTYSYGYGHGQLNADLDRIAGEFVAIGQNPFNTEGDWILSDKMRSIVLRNFKQLPKPSWVWRILLQDDKPACEFSLIKTMVWPDGWWMSESDPALLVLSPPECQASSKKLRYSDSESSPSLILRCLAAKNNLSEAESVQQLLEKPPHVLTAKDLPARWRSAECGVEHAETKEINGKRVLLAEATEYHPRFKDAYDEHRALELITGTDATDNYIVITYSALPDKFDAYYPGVLSAINSITWR